MTDTILAWLLTYWLHSTIALGGMWLASRFLRNRNLALEEAGWKAALFVTLFTSTLQLGLASAVEYRPLAGALVLEAAAPRSEAVATRMSEPREGAFALRGDAENDGAETTMTTAMPDPMATGAGSSLGMARPRGPILATALVLWLFATSILLTRFVISYVLLLSRLKERRRLSGGPHVALLARLRRRAGVARRVGLSVCTALAVPLALGLRRWEVCLPSKVTEEFSAEEQETVLAHELAHLVRYDTLWLLGARMLAGSCFFQPLNLVAVSRLCALSELRCDDWAVERTGRPVTLAKCLTRVASWRSNRWGAFPVPAMAASSRSQFGARVRRLVARSYPQPQGGVPRWVKVSAIPLLLVFVAAAPGVVERSRPEVMLEASGTAPQKPSPLPRVPQVALAPSAPPEPAAGFAPPAPAPVASQRVASSPVAVAPPAPPAAPTPVTPPVPALPAPPRAPMPAFDRIAPLVPLAGPTAVPLSTARFARLSADGSYLGSDEPPEARERSDDRDAEAPSGSDEAHHEDAYHDAHDDELDAMEDALEAELETLEEELESELEVLEDQLDDHMDALEEKTEVELEALLEEFEDGLENDVEVAEEELEALEVSLEAQLRERALSEAEAEAVERKLERLEETLGRFEELKDRELERMAQRFERAAERLWGREFEREFERAFESQERALERRLESAARQMEQASRRLEIARSAEEREQLLAEIRDRARLMLPSQEELAEIRAHVESVETQLAPRMKEFERIQKEFRQALEEWRSSYATELEMLRRQNQESMRGVY